MMFLSPAGGQGQTGDTVSDQVDPQDVDGQQGNGQPRKGAKKMVRISPNCWS
jgi:hypothetical protein